MDLADAQIEMFYLTSAPDCSQSPIFPWDFRDSSASIELPPSWFLTGSVTWGERLNFRGEREWGFSPTQRTLTRAPLGSSVRHFPQIARAVTNQADDGSSIEAYESRKS